MKNRVYLYSFQIFEANQLLYDNGLDKLSLKRRDKIRKYHFFKDKIRCLLGELILSYALRNEYNISDKLEFKYNKYGKPYLQNINDIYFNISHSGEWVICAISDCELGVDIERIQKHVPNWTYIFSEVEQQMIEEWKKLGKAELFYKFWTLKESYIKAIGQGLNMPMNTFSIQLLNNQIILNTREKVCSEYNFISKKFDENHYMSLCICSPLKITMIQKICSREELLLFCS